MKRMARVEKLTDADGLVSQRWQATFEECAAVAEENADVEV